MKVTGFSFALGIFLGSQLAYGQTAVEIDATKSRLEWTGSKVLIKTEHTGTAQVKSGNVQVDTKGNPTAARVVVDMTTIVNTDLTDKEKNTKLVGHLKSDDFFGIEKHPEAVLVIDEFKRTADSTFDVTGKLTIKGKTEPITFQAKTAGANGMIEQVTADLTFNRAKYDVRYGSGTFFQNLGDKAINDEIKLKATMILKSGIKLAQKS